MTNEQSKQYEQAKQPVDRSEQEARKPFEAPELHREAGLTETTAERTFTFSSGS